MERIRTAALAAAIGLVLAGCASGDGGMAGRHGGGDTDHAAGGGRHAGGIGEPADAADAERTIEVRALDAMAFEPATIEVAAGEVVTFVVTNAGEAVHEFVLGDAAMQEAHAEEMAAMGDSGAHMSHDAPNAVTVGPGETAELTWRFGEAASLRYACHEPGHFEAGMVGELTVS